VKEPAAARSPRADVATSSAAAAQPSAAASDWRRNFAVVWVANFLTAVGMTTFLRLFPLHLREIGMRDDRAIELWSGALVAAAPLTAAFMGPVWGALGDRIGRKPMMLRANLAITFFVGVMWFARAPVLLLVLRLLQGCFSGFIAPAMTLVSVTAPPERQGRVAGTLHTSVLAGTILGPWLGGTIGDHFAYRHAFLVCAASSLLALALIHFFVSEPPRARRPTTAAAAGRAVESSLRHVLADAREFLAPGPLRTMIAGVFLVRGAAVLADPVLALYVPSLRGARPGHEGSDTGWAAAATALATLLVMPIWGRRGDERGHARQLALCSIVAAFCVAPQSIVRHVFQLYALCFASGVFLAGILPSAFGLAASLSPVEKRGAANGFMFSAIGLANALGPLLGGVIAAVLGIRPLFLIAGVTMLGGSLWLARAGLTSGTSAAARASGGGDAANAAPEVEAAGAAELE
jgi:DHA1 family multidrug resistance protein-like MFS transporter